MNNQNWDDLRFVLAVAKHGSLNAAAAALGVTHATVMRRVAAFETRYGCVIFEKAQSGYKVLPEAASVLNAIGAVDEAVLATERAIVQADQIPAGLVRIASTDSLCQLVLPKVVRTIGQLFPDIETKLLSANVHHDLTRMSADIAVRPAVSLGDGLVGEVAGHLDFGVYAAEKAGEKWLQLEGVLRGSVAGAWMDSRVPEQQIIGGSDSFLVLQHMAAAGHGRAILPRLVGASDARLREVDVLDRALSAPVWVATLEEFAKIPRITLVQKLVIEQLREMLSPA